MAMTMQSLDHDVGFTERRRFARPDGTLGMRPVDRNFLRRFTLGNGNLEREVLTMFVEQAPTYIARLQQAERHKDWIMAAHTLKGTARSIGAWRVARAAEAAEDLSEAASIDRYTFAVDMAVEAVDEAVAFIRSIYAAA